MMWITLLYGKNADIVAVLAHYNVELNGDGEQRKGLCPFHEDKRPSLNVNVQKNIFKCHACGSGGNIIGLVQQIDPELDNPRKAALAIAKLSGIPARPNGGSVAKMKKKVIKKAVVSNPEPVEVLHEKPALDCDVEDTFDGIPYNRPLTFKLQLEPILDGGDSVVNQFIEERDLGYDRLTELGIGMSQRGSMKDRLAIPILNKDEELVAYCGRDVGLFEDKNEPKYKFPPKFRKDFELYGWNVAQHFDHLVLVESFLTVVKHGGAASKFGETGFGVASLMGTTISDFQIELLLEAFPKVIVCFDGDEAGLTAAPQVAARIAEFGMWVTVRGYADGQKPHQDNIETFCQSFGEI